MSHQTYRQTPRKTTKVQSTVFTQTCFSKCHCFYQNSIGEDAKDIFSSQIDLYQKSRAQTISVITSGEAHLSPVTEHGFCESVPLG